MIYGLDVGDGESAVARLGEGAYAPEVLSIGGEKSIVSALAVMQDGTLRIGGGACQLQPGMKELHLRFKQKFLSGSAEAELCIERFARALYMQLEHDGYFEGDFAPGFLIGCPSGWNDAAKERYRQLFERYYPGQAHLVKDFWMPNRDWEGCDVDDPSARVLKNYGASGV